MDVVTLSYYLDPVRQAVIGIDGESVIYANTAAKADFGENICGKSAKELIPSEILNSASGNFSCSTNIADRPAMVSVIKEKDSALLYIDLVSEDDMIRITPHMMNYLRNCATGIKMSADRCFGIRGHERSASEKYVSVLYHYYYCLIRGITQLDSAVKLEGGEFALNTLPTDLVKLCYELTDTVSKLSESNGIDIKFECEESSLVAVIDPMNIELVLLNLFSNSIKNSPPGGSIVLSLAKSQGNILLSLDDTGKGIPKERLAKVFSINSDTFDISNPNTGLGLGLFICGSIIRLHKGVMFIESREDEGTHVRIKLPANEQSSTVFKTPEKPYRSVGVSPVLTALSDVLKSDCYGLRFED